MGKNGAALLPPGDTYRIGEVASLTQVEPHVLRYWESEFPVLCPPKAASGQRLYRRSDIDTVLTIKRLLYDEGFTIAGARKQLESGNGDAPTGIPEGASKPRVAAPNSQPGSEAWRTVRNELAALLTLLSRR